jgi:hypothetical protein
MISQTLGIAGPGHLDRRIQPQLRRRRGLDDRFLEGKEPTESAGLSFTWRRAARGADSMRPSPPQNAMTIGVVFVAWLAARIAAD